MIVMRINSRKAVFSIHDNMTHKVNVGPHTHHVEVSTLTDKEKCAHCCFLRYPVWYHEVPSSLQTNEHLMCTHKWTLYHISFLTRTQYETLDEDLTSIIALRMVGIGTRGLIPLH